MLQTESNPEMKTFPSAPPPLYLQFGRLPLCTRLLSFKNHSTIFQLRHSGILTILSPFSHSFIFFLPTCKSENQLLLCLLSIGLPSLFSPKFSVILQNHPGKKWRSQPFPATTPFLILSTFHNIFLSKHPVPASHLQLSRILQCQRRQHSCPPCRNVLRHHQCCDRYLP